MSCPNCIGGWISVTVRRGKETYTGAKRCQCNPELSQDPKPAPAKPRRGGKDKQSEGRFL